MFANRIINTLVLEVMVNKVKTKGNYVILEDRASRDKAKATADYGVQHILYRLTLAVNGTCRRPRSKYVVCHTKFPTSWLSYAMRNAPLSLLKVPSWHLAKRLVKEPDVQLFRFSSSDFKALATNQTIEEEAYDAITKGRYYPVRIGDVIENKYQIVGKLGYGLGSTVWLANDFR